MDVQRIAHYEIHERLGEGGMGEVWKAFDPKLQRTVAIKILKPALDCGVPASGRDAEARSRLLSEARAASGLNHPNICTIHDVGEAATIPSDSSPHTTRESLGGVVPFIVMEYVEGKPLSELIPADGLPPDTVIRYGAQIADALAHAHEKGIVHRDLKSANIVITPGGRAKVLDFGVADRLPDADAEALTQTFDLPPTIHQAPSLVGTLAYMAPEVLQGAAATARSDIWALGVLLYEMASGRLPFSGTTQTAVIASVVKDSPEALPSKVSAGLRTVAQRCLQKEPGQRYGQAVAVHAVLEALQSGGSATQTKQPSSSTAPETSTGTSSEPTKGSVPWIAVLPFKVQGGGEEIRDLADGLTEDILTGLSQFPYLSVLGADVTVERRGPDMDARALGKAIGARYVIDGRIRASATKLRVNVHLLDTATGTNLWAERFDRALDDADIFDLQDDLTDRIVATIADTYGALARALGELALAKSPDTLTADEAVWIYFSFNQRAGPDEHLQARAALERAVENHPRHPTAWACLSLANMEEYRHNLNPRAGSLDRALEYARRALEIDRTSQLGYHALAGAHYFRRDISAFREAAERAAALNPRDTFTVAHMGLLTAYGGDWATGTRMARRAMALNPHHPGWYHFGEAVNHYRLGEYEQALAAIQRINMPLLSEYHVWLAATNGHLGREGPAREAVRELLAIDPNFAETAYREQGKWYFAEESRALLERLFDGLRKAGLEIPASGDSPDRVVHGTEGASDAAMSRPKTSIAVLPFTNTSPDPDQEYFSDGLTEEIISDLSGIRALTVISRTSAMQLKGTTKSIKEIGHELNVGYVLEGSVRKVGNAVRVTARLVDAETDAQVWSEKYSGTLDDVFEIQERLSRSIVTALELKLSTAEDQRIGERSIGNVDAYVCYLKGRQEIELQTGDSFGRALELFRRGLDLIGENALLHAGMGYVYWSIVNAGLGPDEYIAQAEEHAKKAVALQPDSVEANLVLGLLEQAFRGDQRAALIRFRKAAAVNPDDPHILFWLTVVYLVVGKPDAGLATLQHLQVVDPLTPVAQTAATLHAFGAGRYDHALDFPWHEMPNGPYFVFLHALALTYNQQFDELRALAADRVRDEWRDSFADITRMAVLAVDRDEEGIDALLAGDVAKTFRRDPLWAYWIASLAALAEQDDGAIDWLTAAVEQGFVNYPVLSEFDPFLRRLGGQPRFDELLVRAKHEWETFDA